MNDNEQTKKQRKIRKIIIDYCFEYDDSTVELPYILFVITNIYNNVSEARVDLPHLFEEVVKTIFFFNGDKPEYAIKNYEFGKNMITLSVNPDGIKLIKQLRNSN